MKNGPVPSPDNKKDHNASRLPILFHRMAVVDDSSRLVVVMLNINQVASIESVVQPIRHFQFLISIESSKQERVVTWPHQTN